MTNHRPLRVFLSVVVAGLALSHGAPVFAERGAEAGMCPQELRVAIAKEDHDSLRRRFAGRFDIECRFDRSDQTPLMRAASRGDASVQKWLLDLGANIHAVDSRGNTALIIAARSGSLATLKQLLLNGARIDAKNKGGFTALEIAYNAQKPAVLEFLVEAGARNEKPKKVKRFIRGERVRRAIERGTEKQAMAALDAMSKPCRWKDRYKSRFVHYAAKKGKLAVLQYLVRKGCSIKTKGMMRYTPLMDAAYNKHFDVAKYLLARGAKVDARYRNGWPKDGGTALLLAAHKGSLEIVELLVENGANLNARSAQRDTALIYAARDGHPGVVRYLMKAGAKLNLRGENRRTALSAARKAKHQDIVELLEAASR